MRKTWKWATIFLLSIFTVLFFLSGLGMAIERRYGWALFFGAIAAYDAWSIEGLYMSMKGKKK